MIKLCLRSADVDVDVVDEDVVVVVALLSYSPLPREGGKWNAEALLPGKVECYHKKLLNQQQQNVPASEDVGDERVPGNIDLCPA